MLQPDEALAALVGVGFVANAAQRQGGGYRLERLSGDGDADNAALSSGTADPVLAGPLPRPQAWSSRRCRPPGSPPVSWFPPFMNLRRNAGWHKTSGGPIVPAVGR